MRTSTGSPPERAGTCPPRMEDLLGILVSLAPSLGWRWALTSVFQNDLNLVRYTTDPSRLACVDLLDLDNTQDVLEIGAGLGQMTVALGRKAKSLTALEVVPQQAEFVRQRCRQEGLRNLRVVCGGSDARLAFPSASFDRVVLNYVLEWCANRTPEDPRLVQERMLSEARRVLRPGGVLFVATKNRFGAPYLLGGRDEHSGGRRWSCLVPERLRPLLWGTAARARLPSRRWLERALSRAGFTELSGLWAYPDARWPRGFVPLARPDKIGAVLNSADGSIATNRRSALLMRFAPRSLLKEITPSLVYLAKA